MVVVLVIERRKKLVAKPDIDRQILIPFDIVLHENRRDLRGLYVFSAWLNNTDAKAGNTLDTIVEENGVRFIRHYLSPEGIARSEAIAARA